MDKRVLRVILNSPFAFTYEKMQALDTKPIRFLYLCSIQMKKSTKLKLDESKDI